MFILFKLHATYTFIWNHSQSQVWLNLSCSKLDIVKNTWCGTVYISTVMHHQMRDCSPVILKRFSSTFVMGFQTFYFPFKSSVFEFTLRRWNTHVGSFQGHTNTTFFVVQSLIMNQTDCLYRPLLFARPDPCGVCGVCNPGIIAQSRDFWIEIVNPGIPGLFPGLNDM